MADKEIEIVSCPDPDQITDCADCVKKGLANCEWAVEQEFKKEDKKNEKNILEKNSFYL